MKIELHQNIKPQTDSSTLVLFVTQPKSEDSDPNKSPRCHKLPQELKKLFNGAIEEKAVTGSLGETLFFRHTSAPGYKHTLFVSLGAWSSEDHESLRLAAGYLESAIGANKLFHCTIDFDTLGATQNIAELIQSFTEGILLSSYRFDELMSSKKDKSKEVKVNINVSSVSSSMKEAFNNGKIIAEMVCFSRRLGDLPGNLMNPTILANEVKRESKGLKLKVTVWDKVRIKKESMGGLLCVSLGSDQEPRFIKMEYNGGKSSQKPLVFVGKGLTFDSGGISIKPSASMEEMKYDMCGGANVIGAILAMAKLKLKVNVVALVPATENLPGPSAVKPGDIIFGRNGKSYEVNNTDAEGRLILSDALCIASELKPQIIVDAATLTGAMQVALGNIHTGYFTKNSDLKNKIESAAKSSGELVWQMPLCDFHTKDMKGTYADLSNMSSGKGAGSATAAAFLEQFVDNKIPWAHFDIAGTGWSTGNRFSYNPKKGASGVMVRTFVALAKQYE